MEKKMSTRQTAEYLMAQIEGMIVARGIQKRGLLFDEKLIDEILEWLWLIANDDKEEETKE